PSFEELCKKNYPRQWKISTSLMRLIFLGVISISIYNNYKHAAEAGAILSENTELIAEITDFIQILEDGKYTDYIVDLKLLIDGVEQDLNLDIPEEIFEENYREATELNLIYSSPQEYNLRSYYEHRANMLSNWLNILIGYAI